MAGSNWCWSRSLTFQTTGEVVQEQDLPEVAKKKLKDLNDRRPLHVSRFRSTSLAIATIIASTIVIVAIAFGVGLGVGLKKSSSNRSSTSSSASPSNSTSSPNTSSPTLTRGVANDTVLASVMTSDGNRHVFLQDINGTLRHAVFSSTANLWLPDVGYLLPPAPISPERPRTPITATYPEVGDQPGWILVYYVNTNNTLSALTYDIDIGVLGGDAFNGSTAIKSDSRCITTATVRKSANDETLYTLLFFEAPSGNMTFLYGRRTPQSEWEW